MTEEERLTGLRKLQANKCIYSREAVRALKAFDHFSIAQRNGDNLQIVIVQALYIGLASVYGVNDFPQLRILRESNRIINVELFHRFRKLSESD